MKIRMEGIHIIIDYGEDEIYLLHSIPFGIMHLLGILGPILFCSLFGVKWYYILLAVIMYCVMMSGVTIGYHRLFSHHSFKTPRWFQFVIAWWAMTSTQKGILWWAAKHRDHHKYSDKEGDPHSPHINSFWFAHFIWILTKKSTEVNLEKRIRYFYKYKELRWLNNNDMLPPIILGALIFFTTFFISNSFIQATGMLIIGYFLPITLCYHATFSINSLAHVWGNKEFHTGDESRNNLFLALITFGEGWHNNHHHKQGRARQGIKWWQIDISYYLIVLMSKFGLVYSIRT